MLLDDPLPPPGNVIVAPPVFPAFAAPPAPCGGAPELEVALQATDARATRSRLNAPAAPCLQRAPSDSSLGVPSFVEKITIEDPLCRGADQLAELHETLRNNMVTNASRLSGCVSSGTIRGRAALERCSARTNAPLPHAVRRSDNPASEANG